MKHLAPRFILIVTAVWLLTGAASAYGAGISVSITGVDPQAPRPGDTVKFTAQANAGGQLTYYWNFDYEANHNGFEALGTSPTHQYDTRGARTVVVYVTDNNKNSGYSARKVIVGAPPEASFSIDPGSPVTGQQVTFTNTSTSPDGGEIKTSEWTIDGQPGGTQPTATTTFSSEGEHTVSLRVTDDLGYAATHQETFVVTAPSPAAQPEPTAGGGFDTTATPAPQPLPDATTRLAQLDPKPFVRIKGHTTGKGAQIDLFTVRAVGGARIAVRCVGKHCPVKRPASKRVKGSRARTLRFRTVEGWLRAGIVVEVRVTKKGYVGRYTRFRMGKLKPPVRWDGCLMPGAKRPVDC